MHKCSKCGNEFESKFCPCCGTKWVDPDVCPKCGAHHEPGALFCGECGARLDGKVNCPHCFALVNPDDTFCGECGASLKGGAAKSEAVNQTAVEGNGTEKREKVKSCLVLASTILILVSALIGLIFTFVSGTAVVVSSDGVHMRESNMLYYYFGDAYKEIKVIRKRLLDVLEVENLGDAREFALYFPAVLGTIVSALGIAAVVVLSGVTVFRVYKKYGKKEETNVIAPAVATYFTFVTLATVLLTLTAYRYDYGESGYGVYSEAVFSSPTLTGLIVGGIFLLHGTVLSIVINCKFNNGKPDAGIVAVLGSVLVVVILALVSLPMVELKIIAEGGTEKMSYSPLFVLGKMALIEDYEKLERVSAFAAVSSFIGLALIILSVSALTSKVKSVFAGKGQGNCVSGVCLVGCAVLYLVFAILTSNAVNDAMLSGYSAAEKAELRLKNSFGGPISTLVISVITCLVEIVGRFLNKMKDLHTLSDN